MAGSLTLGGLAAGTPGGNLVLGPNTVAGKRVIGDMIEVALEANVDYVVKVPSEAVQWAVFFGATNSPTEVKVGSNIVTTANGMPVGAQGFASAPVYSSVTELKFKAASPPSAFQLVFV